MAKLQQTRLAGRRQVEGVGGRVRHDPARRIGNENALAAGVDLTCVGVLSDRELRWIRNLADEEEAEDGVAAARAAELARRKATSDARKAGWVDTVQARHDAFLQAREAEKAEAERRRAALDELHREQEDAERRAKLASLELRNLRDDPRGRNAKSVVALHEALKERDEQVAFRQAQEAGTAAAQRRERAEAALHEWGSTAEVVQAQLAQRQRNVEEKNANLEAVLFAVEERKRERKAALDERAALARDAAEERAENEQERQERLLRERACQAENVAHARPALTKSQRLQQQIAQDAITTAAMQEQQRRADEAKRATAAKLQEQQAALERVKQVGLRACEERQVQPSPVQRTQDRFANESVSFLAQMEEGSAAREQRSRALRREVAAAAALPASAHRTAAACANGCLSAEEERAYLDEMREYPAKLRAETDAERATQRAAAARVAREQLAQAEARRAELRHAKEDALAQAHAEEEQRRADDARYREFIASQLPADIGPVLYERAMQID